MLIWVCRKLWNAMLIENIHFENDIILATAEHSIFTPDNWCRLIKIEFIFIEEGISKWAIEF